MVEFHRVGKSRGPTAGSILLLLVPICMALGAGACRAQSVAAADRPAAATQPAGTQPAVEFLVSHASDAPVLRDIPRVDEPAFSLLLLPASDVSRTVLAYAGGVKISELVLDPSPLQATAVRFDRVARRFSVERRAGGNHHMFRYRPGASEAASSVSVAGSFNGWSKDTHPMARAADGSFGRMVFLQDGVHHYKFVVDGDRWVNDPGSDTALEQGDGHGGVNSAVLIGPDARRLPAPLEGEINTQIVRVIPAEPVTGELLLVRVRVQANDVESVTAHVSGDGRSWRTVRLRKVQTGTGFDQFAAMVRTGGGQVRYYLSLDDGDARVLFGQMGVIGGESPEQTARETAFVVSTRPTFATPDWAKHVVWYQIFPERFRNGETSNDPPGTLRWTSNWWETQPGEAVGEENFYGGAGNVWRRRYGGDLQGVQEKLGYLRELGVTALYFNPIFEGESMHKYDATDFRQIDDNFGLLEDPALVKKDAETLLNPPETWRWSASDRVFLEFLAEARRQGFRVIIDGVWNHTGQAHPAFQDVVRKGRASRFADWFQIHSWEPLAWKAWDGPSGHLPCFAQDPKLGLAAGPREHVFAVTQRWMAPNGDVGAGVDGWRLDVANDLPHVFWRDWRKLVKGINPDAYISGEIWTWAQPWLQGDQFDAVMNYQFAMPAQEFFVNVKRASTPTQFADRLETVAYAYPYQVALVQQNLFDSHDTDRLASMFVNPDLPYDGANRLQDSGPSYDKSAPTAEHWRRLKQAVVCQMTFVGAPMIYYGTEAGMWSPDDPSNRMPMVWQDLEPYDDPEVRFNGELFGFFQRVIAVRRALPSLRLGLFYTLLADDEAGVLAYGRCIENQQVICVLNRSSEERIVQIPVDGMAPGTRWIDWLSEHYTELVPADVSDPQSRPQLRVRGNVRPIEPVRGSIIVALPAYGSAVLASAAGE